MILPVERDLHWRFQQRLLASLDQIDAKAATIVVKHYGSREAAFEAARKRSDIREVVASHLAREVMPK